MRHQTRSYRTVARGVSVDIPDRDASLTYFVASTDQPDRYDDVVEQTWNLETYRENPVLLYGHRQDLLTVGTVPDARVIEDVGLVIGVDFDEGHELGAQVKRQVAEGFLNGVSVGFIPGRSVARRSLDDTHQWYDADSWGFVHSDNELLENSVVAVPANPGALIVNSLAAYVERGLPIPGRDGGFTASDLDVLVERMRAEAVTAAEAAVVRMLESDDPRLVAFLRSPTVRRVLRAHALAAPSPTRARPTGAMSLADWLAGGA